MKTISCVVAGIGLGAAMSWGQSGPGMTGARPSLNGVVFMGLRNAVTSWNSAVGDKVYEASFEGSYLFPKWTPLKPLPLSLTEAERIAREKLKGLTSEAGNWEVEEFSICPWRGTWMYVVRMRPSQPLADRREDFALPINFSGQAAKLRVWSQRRLASVEMGMTSAGTMIPKPQEDGFWSSVGGMTYEALFEAGARFTDWKPSEALPLSLARAVEIARGELKKLTAHPADWEVEELGISRWQGKWIYVVRMEPTVQSRAKGNASEELVLPISFSGETGKLREVKMRI